MRTRRGRRRSARGGELVVGVGQLDRSGRAADHADRRGQQPVVRPDEDRGAVAHLDRHRSAVGADPGIDDGEHHARRQVLRGCAPASGRRPARRAAAISWLMSITTTGGAIWRITDLHDADELVGRAVVGEERDRVVAVHGGRAT